MSSEPSAAPLRGDVTVELPTQVVARVDGDALIVGGPLGEVRRSFPSGALTAEVVGTAVRLSLRVPAQRKRSRALLNTWERHVRNLAQGVSTGFEARMKVVAAHFPMKVQVKDQSLVIENFLGEKYPRTASILPGVAARVEGDWVVLSGTDLEKVGQSAANIERTTRIRRYDPRVFQDGIYIVDRAHPKAEATP